MESYFNHQRDVNKIKCIICNKPYPTKNMTKHKKTLLHLENTYESDVPAAASWPWPSTPCVRAGRDTAGLGPGRSGYGRIAALEGAVKSAGVRSCRAYRDAPCRRASILDPAMRGRVSCRRASAGHVCVACVTQDRARSREIAEPANRSEA